MSIVKYKVGNNWASVTSSGSIATDSNGAVLMDIKTITDVHISDKLFMKKGEKIYVDTLSGTISITFYPCKGSI